MQIKHFLFLIIVTLTVSIQAQTYNYYFGNIHAHSSYSDGNKDSSTSLMTKPLQDFNFARAAQHIDFYGICEHNHYSAGMMSPVNYHRGLADADSANKEGVFVALYGMEWGVISGGGHVVVYGYDSLMGWDNNDYDVYVAQNDYASLWKKINEKPGAFAYLAHPQTTDYTNLYSSAYDIAADNAIIGTAARSGPAFSTNSSYGDASSSNYIPRYNDALKKGYHVGVGLDHDTHNSVFGMQTAGRLVVLAPTLTRVDILSAIRSMRFYSSDDWNTKVNFTISNQPMGSILTQTGSPTINVSVLDPDVENIASIAIYSGVPGSGTTPSILTTLTNTSNVSYVHTITNNTSRYYYLKITQSDGDIIWTSPIWYTRNDALTNTPPVANFAQSTTTLCAGQSVTLTDNTTNGPTNWNWTLTGALPNNSTHQSVVATYYTAGTYTISMNASNAYGVSTTKTNTVTVFPIPHITVANDSICAGETATLTATGAGTYSWSTGSTNASIYVNPTSTTFYIVTGTLSGCSSYANASVIVSGCVGIEEFRKEKIMLYPNPANQFITIDFKDLSNTKTVELYNTVSEMILSKTSSDRILNLDVSGLANGVYLIKVIADNNVYTVKKFIIERK